MCVIMVCDREKPSLSMLEKAEKINKDGGGIGWVEGGKVKFKKGLTAQEIFEITKKVDLPIVIHFRAASVGGVIKELCHPFPLEDDIPTKIEGEADAVLFHNGHISKWTELLYELLMNGKINKIPEGPISDTRLLGILVKTFGQDILKMIRTKTAILTKDKKVYVYHPSMWHEKNTSIWLSSSIDPVSTHYQNYKSTIPYIYYP